ncbi:MAG: hypothetical protein J6R23_05610 [Spirochaetales bacterium]|nr:hypothetical protein [Spirochaetales bacterium]
MRGKMMIAIVNKGDAGKVMAAARSAGAPGGTIANAKGTATSSILAALGFGDSKREVLYSMIEENLEKSIGDAVSTVKTKGIVVFLKSGLEGEDSMNSDLVMIQVICEAGYAEDAMMAARKAGAKGGSIINAHGTAKEDDTKFFGYPIVAEKEMLIIVEDRAKAEAIEESIRSLDCLKQKGKAIMFTMPVSSFKTLG